MTGNQPNTKTTTTNKQKNQERILSADSLTVDEVRHLLRKIGRKCRNFLAKIFPMFKKKKPLNLGILKVLAERSSYASKKSLSLDVGQINLERWPTGVETSRQ